MEPNKNLLPLWRNSGKKRQTWVPAAYLHFLFLFLWEIRAWTAGSPSPVCPQSTQRLQVQIQRPELYPHRRQKAAAHGACHTWPVPIMAPSTWHQYAVEDLTFFFRQRQMNTLSSSEAWGRRMRNSGVIWIPRSRGGVSQPQKSFSLMLTHKASPQRPVYQTATCYAEKLDYSCYNKEGEDDNDEKKKGKDFKI